MSAVLAPVVSVIERHYQALRVPITIACAGCGSGDFDEVTLAGTGTLHYAAHNIAPAPHPRFASIAPYVFGHVILDEGITVQGIVKGIEPTAEATRALFEGGPTGVTLDVLVTDDLPVIAFRLS
jgi:hypothetical protein